MINAGDGGSMARIGDVIEAAMPELESWIGRQQIVEDDISLGMVRRVAAMLDIDPERFVHGSELPPHWFSMFFCNNAMQSRLGPDGHPDKGVFLPPIPLPRRMGAGRRVRIEGKLRVGQAARRVAEVVGIAPKAARTGHIFVLTMRHTIEAGGSIVAVEDFDAVYREGLPPGTKNPVPAPVAPPTGADWAVTVPLTSALNFRYSAITWNAHRIHYDVDYSRLEEGYPHAVSNGGLTMQLILDAALPRLPGPLTGFEARLTRPLWVGNSVTIQGGPAEDGRMSCWGVDKDGAHCATLEAHYNTGRHA